MFTRKLRAGERHEKYMPMVCGCETGFAGSWREWTKLMLLSRMTNTGNVRGGWRKLRGEKLNECAADKTLHT
jgi:hypothetical protein